MSTRTRPKSFSTIHRETTVPFGLDEAFAFFADAGNLEKLTPSWLSFKILTPRPIPMHVGALIDYRITVRGLPMRWRTEIITWEPPGPAPGPATGPTPAAEGPRRAARFVDLQIKGPYRWWHHEHRFEELASGGTVVVDHVEYRAPLHWLVNPLMVRRDVERIFDYRAGALAGCLRARSRPNPAERAADRAGARA